VVAAPDALRGRLQGLTTRQLVTACGRLRLRAAWDIETAATAASLRALARRIQVLDAEIADHTRAITLLVRAWRPDLLSRCGVGPIVAAVVLCAWSHAGRCRSDAAFAMLGGAAPIPAPDLGNDRLGGPLADPSDGVEAITGLCERGDDPIDRRVQCGDGPLQLLDVVQGQPQQQGVMVTEPASQRLAQLGELVAQAAPR
jgi:hypothetical protein